MRCHAGAIADHERGRRADPGNRGRKAEHDLRVHVAAIGSVDLAAHAQRSTALALPYTHCRVRPLAERKLPHAAVLEEPLPRRPVHRLTRVDRGAEVDEARAPTGRSEEHTSELQSPVHLVCRLLLEKKKQNQLDPQMYTKIKTIKKPK